MTEVEADAQQKDEKKEPWTEKVTVKVWAESGKIFLDPKENVDAYRLTAMDGKTIFAVKRWIGGRAPGKSSEIITADGTVYVVTINNSLQGPGPFLCHVEPKKVAKKP